MLDSVALSCYPNCTNTLNTVWRDGNMVSFSVLTVGVGAILVALLVAVVVLLSR